jgi:MFS family permease
MPTRDDVGVEASADDEPTDAHAADREPAGGGAGHDDAAGGTGVRAWLTPPVIGVALVMAAAGFAQFSPTAALADVAEHYGDLREGDTLAEQAGLPGSVLGAGLAVVRLSALAALPLAGLGDSIGRRQAMLMWVCLGLAITTVAAVSPSYWWFVAALALARPLLTATDTLGEVMAAELSETRHRAKAIALMTGAYAVGAGTVSVLRGLLGESVSFRAVFALSAVPLALVLLTSRRIVEPARFARAVRERRSVSATPLLAALRPAHRSRVAVVAAIAFASGFVTGPLNTFVFVYAENVLDASTTLTGTLVVAAGPVGLLGLVAGRALSDRAGRRLTGAASLVALCAAGLLAYSGSIQALVVGYLLGMLFGAAYATPMIALANELFPTRVRAAVAGWLVISGVAGAATGLLLAGSIADAGGSFTSGMAYVCVPAALASALVALVPETRGLDLED